MEPVRYVDVYKRQFLILYCPAPNAIAMEGEPVGVSIAAVHPAKIAMVKGLGLSLIHILFCYALQKLDNPLAMNLFWETSLFLGLMFVSESKEPSMRKNLNPVSYTHLGGAGTADPLIWFR